MAMRTVDESDGKRKRGQARREADAATARLVRAELACSGSARLLRRCWIGGGRRRRIGAAGSAGGVREGPCGTRAAVVGRGCRGARRRRWTRC